jgi:DNA repair protein RecO (recombination protein O)
MLLSTKAIVLRTVKYGDTSLIVTMYTELKGIQSFMAQGVRKKSKYGSAKAAYYMVGSLLHISYNYIANKSLLRITDMQYATLTPTILTNVIKNAIVVFSLEVVYNTIKEEETNTELFYFLEQYILYIEHTQNLTWIPHYFVWQYAALLGFRIDDNFTAHTPNLHLLNGHFMDAAYIDNYTVDAAGSEQIFLLTQASLNNLPAALNNNYKSKILHWALTYLKLHVPDMSKVKSLDVLESIFA